MRWILSLLLTGMVANAWAETDLVKVESVEEREHVMAVSDFDKAVVDAALAPKVLEDEKEEAALPSSVVAVKTNEVPTQKESEIPVLTSLKEKKSQAQTNPFGRLVLSLGIIGCLALGLVMFSKWWQKRHGKSLDNNRIRVLAQHHLGPKKTLTIIRVAGETMLIGVTDHNITMLKTLALLEDEEIPTVVPKSFAQEMAKNDDDDEDDSAFAQIREKISSKIKEMRPLS